MLYLTSNTLILVYASDYNVYGLLVSTYFNNIETPMASHLNRMTSIEVIFNYSSVSSDEDFKHIYLLYIVSASI